MTDKEYRRMYPWVRIEDGSPRSLKRFRLFTNLRGSGSRYETRGIWTTNERGHGSYVARFDGVNEALAHYFFGVRSAIYTSSMFSYCQLKDEQGYRRKV